MLVLLKKEAVAGANTETATEFARDGDLTFAGDFGVHLHDSLNSLLWRRVPYFGYRPLKSRRKDYHRGSEGETESNGDSEKRAANSGHEIGSKAASLVTTLQSHSGRASATLGKERSSE